MATSLLSFTLIPAYTVPNPPFPKTSPTLYASSNTVFLLFFKYFFTEYVKYYLHLFKPMNINHTVYLPYMCYLVKINNKRVLWTLWSTKGRTCMGQAILSSQVDHVTAF